MLRALTDLHERALKAAAAGSGEGGEGRGTPGGVIRHNHTALLF